MLNDGRRLAYTVKTYKLANGETDLVQFTNGRIEGDPIDDQELERILTELGYLT